MTTTNIFIDPNAKFCTREDAERAEKEPGFVPREVEWKWFKECSDKYPVVYANPTDHAKMSVGLGGEYGLSNINLDLVPYPEPKKLVPWESVDDLPVDNEEGDVWIHRKDGHATFRADNFFNAIGFSVGGITAGGLRDRYVWSRNRKYVESECQPCGKFV